MQVGTTFYLSRVLGNKIYSNSDKPIAKLLDIIVDLESIRPKVIAFKIKENGKIRIVDISHVSISKRNRQYYIQCDQLEEIEIFQNHTLFLGKHILDKQIVDVDGRKVVRVNDLRLAVLSDGAYTVAVDVGFEGFLRRLGIAKPLKKVLKPFHISITSHLLLWDEVEAVDFTNRGIRLSRTYTKISLMHPSDVADILEELDRSSQLAIFSSLDEEKAADVLEELETDVQVTVLENLSIERAAEMLGKMPADEVADILEELEQARANNILNEMEEEVSNEVRELMKYPEKSVGSIMTTDFISFITSMTVVEVIEELRILKPDSDNVYYLYVVNNDGQLLGNVSLRDLIIAEPHEQLLSIMNQDTVSIYDDEEIDKLQETLTKYNLLSVPVVDYQNKLIGMVIINDLFYELTKSRRRR
jgi:magnesium transporter